MPSTGASSPVMMSAQSPVQTRRRLSSFTRRGSTSAPDPWNTQLVDAPSSSTSRLHIVRLPPPTPQELEKFEKDHAHTRRSSWGPSAIPISKSVAGLSGGAAGSNSGVGTERISFVTPSHSREDSANPPSSPGRKGSFRRVHPSTLSAPLAPNELYDLAMTSIHPRESSAPSASSALPVVFTPLPSSHYLPFIVRSSEVSQLLTQGPPRRLWALIKQIYPQNLTEDSNDPEKWPFAQLERWMFHVCRHEASDRLWVALAKKCITRRSDPLWEKLKNALGVPPELDLDDEDELLDLGVKLDIKNFGKGRTGDLGSAVDDESDGELDEEVEPITALGMTGLVMEGIYPAPPDASAPPTSANQEEQFGFGGADAGMEVIGEEEEEEKASNAPTDLKIDTSEVEVAILGEGDALDASRMVGITIVSQSKRVPLKEFVQIYDNDHDDAVEDSPKLSASPTSERNAGNPLFPKDFSSLSITPSKSQTGGRRNSLSNSLVLEAGRLKLNTWRFQRPHGSEYAVSTASEGSVRGD